MTIQPIIQYKSLIDTHMRVILKQHAQKLSEVNTWGSEVLARLHPFIVSGKSIRGCLVVYIYSLFQEKIPPYVLDVAASLEFFQSGLLIHDDIMDDDETRRGLPSMFIQYEALAKNDRAAQPRRFGISMAISAADLCYFAGYQLLKSIPDTYLSRIISLVSGELSAVTIAQMQDVAGSHLRKRFSKDDILSLYRYKTSRYSFTLPMMLAAIIADTDASTLHRLEQLGETWGLLYQIRDDELAVSGDTGVTGKPVGSDKNNSKQTLASVLPASDMVRMKNKLAKKAHHIIPSLSIDSIHKATLEALTTFCHNRVK